MAGGVAEAESGETFALDELLRANVEAVVLVGALAHTCAWVCQDEKMLTEAMLSAVARNWATTILLQICDLSEVEIEMRMDAKMEELGIAPRTRLDA